MSRRATPISIAVAVLMVGGMGLFVYDAMRSRDEAPGKAVGPASPENREIMSPDKEVAVLTPVEVIRPPPDVPEAAIDAPVRAAPATKPNPAVSVQMGSLRYENADMEVFIRGATLARLENGVKAFGNRDYVWQNIPAAHAGWRYTQTHGGVASNIHVVAKRKVVLYAAAQSGTQDLTGWTEVPGNAFSYNDRLGTQMNVYQRTLEAKEEVDFPLGTWSGMVLMWNDKATAAK